jgi:hypothetical protein
MAKTACRFNTLRIVPLITFQEVIERCKKVEDGTFFEELGMLDLVSIDLPHFLLISGE